LYTSLKAGNDDVKRLITLMTKQSGHTLARSPTGFADEGFEDGELLWRMLNGDEEAFDALYERWERIVYQFALRMSGSVALAEDVTQDVFMALIRSGRHFDPAQGTLAGYLLGMTRNRVLTLLKREQPFVPLAEDGEEEETSLAKKITAHTDPSIELARAERVKAVRQAILSLPWNYREVVVLCSLEEMSYEEAAGVIGCPVGTVRSRLNRARALLADKLKMAGGENGATIFIS
jgi:RNA polymerase sigma-70 factor, ECF subfamily